jgi:hypothetical protein
MTTLAVHHSVENYDTWKAAFDEHAAVRQSHGSTGHRVLRDGNDLLVLLEFPDASAAAAFRADQSLGAAMQKAGVQGAPEISVRTESEQVRY